jgi:hypothetical protein
MNLLCLCTWLAPLFVTPPANLANSGVATENCDMKTVVPAAWCATDKTLIESKDLVSDKSYYACPTCKKISSDPGKCATCNQELEKKTSDRNVCPKCFQKPDTTEACEKSYWECDTCKKPVTHEGMCEKCKTPLKKHVSLARLAYHCDGCGYKSDKPGNCPAKNPEECKNAGKPLAKSCSMSGTFPHGGSAKT